EEVVARVAGADQVVERERDALGGGEAAGPRHRPAHVEREHGGALGGVVGLADFEVALLPEDGGSEVRGGIGRKAFEAFLPMKLLTSARGLMGSARLRLAARFAAFGRSACVGRTFVRGFESALR